MKEKKFYLKPGIRVFKTQVRPALLAESLNDYIAPPPSFESEEGDPFASSNSRWNSGSYNYE